MKILVADDNLFYRHLLEATLAEWGYEPVPARDGQQAWELLQREDAPKLAVIDWMMPGLDGLELCRRVRSLDRAEPTYVILLTARRARDDIIAGLKSGADDYISKPFDREELQARLQVGLRIVGLQGRLAARVGQLEDALSAAQKLEIMGRLAGGVAHDFNNLLTVILGGCELLLDRRRARPEEMLEAVREAALRGAALTRQLLAFSRKQVLVPEVVQPNTLVGDLMKLLSRLIGEDIDIDAQLDPALGCVQVDRAQLEQVLMNLILNARDAMPGGGKLVLETTNVQIQAELPGHPAPVPPGDHVRLRVTDTGCGMEARVQARIFEPFFTTKEPGRGTGLGLATVYGVVQQSRGHIQVDSRPGQGTTFSIYLPRADAPESAPAAPVVATLPSGDRETILLVEDDEDVRAFARYALEESNYAVLEACNGQEALRLSDRWPQPIHLLLTDMVMPGLGGRQLAEKLRPRRPEIKVLYMSGYSEDLAAQTLGSEREFLQKPFTPRSLASKVRAVLEGSR